MALEGMALKIRISAVGGVEDDVTSALAAWLNRDPDVRRVATATVSSSGTSAGAMGALDVIDVALTHVEAVAAVLLAYGAWRQSRRGSPAIELRGNGTHIIMENATPATIARVMAVLSEAQNHQDSPAATE